MGSRIAHREPALVAEVTPVTARRRASGRGPLFPYGGSGQGHPPTLGQRSLTAFARIPGDPSPDQSEQMPCPDDDLRWYPTQRLFARLRHPRAAHRCSPPQPAPRCWLLARSASSNASRCSSQPSAQVLRQPVEAAHRRLHGAQLVSTRSTLPQRSRCATRTFCLARRQGARASSGRR